MPQVDKAVLNLITLSGIRRSKMDIDDKIECFNAVIKQFYDSLKVIEKQKNHSPITTKIMSKCFSVEIAELYGLPLDVVHETKSTTTVTISDEYKSVVESKLSSSKSPTIYNGAYPCYRLHLTGRSGQRIENCVHHNGKQYVNSKMTLYGDNVLLIDIEKQSSSKIHPEAVKIIGKLSKRMLDFRDKQVIYDGRRYNTKNMTIEEESKCRPVKALTEVELVNRPCIWAQGVATCPSMKFPSSFDSIIEERYGGLTALLEKGKSGASTVLMSDVRSKNCAQHPVMRTICDFGSDFAWNAAL